MLILFFHGTKAKKTRQKNKETKARKQTKANNKEKKEGREKRTRERGKQVFPSKSKKQTNKNKTQSIPWAPSPWHVIGLAHACVLMGSMLLGEPCVNGFLDLSSPFPLLGEC